MSLEPLGFPSRVGKYTIYSGTTNASGEYVVTYPVAYSQAPTIIPVQLPTTAANKTIRIVATTATGFTVKVEQRNSVNLLAVDVLLATTVAVNGASVQVVVLPQ